MNEPTFDGDPAALDQSTLTRLSFRRFPAWTQHFWTWVTGKALSGQEPLLRLNPVRYLVWDLAALVTGIAGGWWAITVEHTRLAEVVTTQHSGSTIPSVSGDG